MFCKFCKEYPRLATTHTGQPAVFVSGSNNFKMEPISYHNSSRPYKSCIIQFHHDAETCLEIDLLPKTTAPPKESSIAIAKLGGKELARMPLVFNCGYSIAIHNKPFSDLPMLCQLLKKSDVDIGENDTRP